MNPNFKPLDLQLLKMEKKIEAGVEFFQTQAACDPKLFETFMRKTEGFGVPIQYGVVIIKSAGMARYMNRQVSGITVPQALIDEIDSVSTAERKAKAVEMTVRLVTEIAPMVQGVHFMPLGWSEVAVSVVESMWGTEVNMIPMLEN